MYLTRNVWLILSHCTEKYGWTFLVEIYMKQRRILYHYGRPGTNVYMYRKQTFLERSLKMLFLGRKLNMLFLGRSINRLFFGRGLNMLFLERSSNRLFLGKSLNSLFLRQCINMLEIRISPNECISLFEKTEQIIIKTILEWIVNSLRSSYTLICFQQCPLLEPQRY